MHLEKTHAGTPTHLPARRQEQQQAQLISGTANGDLRAFECLYRDYHPRLSRFLQRLTRSPTLVEELINDTMLVVWQKAASYNHESKVSTWIFAIAYRKALKGQKYLDEPVASDCAACIDAAENQPQLLCQQRRQHLQLMQLLQRLSPDHRTVVTLTYFHDLAYQDIARIVDCPVDTIKTRMFHARHHLQRLLNGQQEDWL